MKKKAIVWMQYYCKNEKYCGAFFTWHDLAGWRSPQTWRYCHECEAKGYPVIRVKPVSEEKREKGRQLLLSLKSKKEAAS